MEYLGHFILGEGVSTNPKKIEAVVNWPVSRIVKQLRGFLGLTGYYKRFVKNYGKLAQPLIALCKAFGSIKWTELENTTFNELKRAMTVAHVLALPDYSQEFVVETNASSNGIGAVLM